MKPFRGLVQEIPGISIDGFDKDNLLSSAFFLSNCHQKHMKGLNLDFFSRLQSKSQYLYCSHISKLFLKSMFIKDESDVFEKYVIGLPLDESRIVECNHINNLVILTVTCISSDHCPGSIMFLFKFNDKTILYTGDIRISKNDFSKLKSLHYSNTVECIPLSLCKVYLDTTFLNTDFHTLPSRLYSLKKLCQSAKDWLEKDPMHIVILEISTLYGNEFIYMELFKLLKKKIHVEDKAYEVYSKMELLTPCVTNKSQDARIHVCMNKMDSMKYLQGLQSRCDVDWTNILTIVPSVQKWIGKNTSKIIEWDYTREQTINVCYSTHASYEELVTFIEYFKPKEVFPLVFNVNNEKEICKLLQNIMKKYQNDKSCEESYALNISKYKMGDTDFKSQFFSDEDSN